MGGRRRSYYLLQILAVQIIYTGSAQCLSLPLTTVPGSDSSSANQQSCASQSSTNVASPPRTVVNFGPAASSSSPKSKSSSSKPGRSFKISNVQLTLPNGDPVPPSSNLVISSYGTPTINSITPKLELPSSVGSLTTVNILSNLNPTGVSEVQSGLPNLLPSSAQVSSNLDSCKPNLPPSVPTVNALSSLGLSNLGQFSSQNRGPSALNQLNSNLSNNVVLLRSNANQNTFSFQDVGSSLNQYNSPQQNLPSLPNLSNNDFGVISFTAPSSNQGNPQINLPSTLNVLPSVQSTSLLQSQVSSKPCNSVSNLPLLSQNGPSQVLTSLPSSVFLNVGSQNFASNLQPNINLLQQNSGNVVSLGSSNANQNTIPFQDVRSSLNQCNSPQQNLPSLPNLSNNDFSVSSLVAPFSNLGNPQINLPSTLNVSPSAPSNSLLQSQISTNPYNFVSIRNSPSLTQNVPSQVLTSLPSSSLNVGLSENCATNSQPNIKLLQQNSGNGLNNDNNVNKVVLSVSSSNPGSSNVLSNNNAAQLTQNLPSSFNFQQIADALNNQAQLSNQLSNNSPNSLPCKQPPQNIPVRFNYQQVANTLSNAVQREDVLQSNSALPAKVLISNYVPVSSSSNLTPTDQKNPDLVSENLNCLISDFVTKFLSTFDPNDFIQSVPNSLSSSSVSPQVLVSSPSISNAPQSVTFTSSSLTTPCDSSSTIEVFPQSSDVGSSTDSSTFPIVLPTCAASSSLSQLPPLASYPAPLPTIIVDDSGSSSNGLKDFVKILLLQQVLNGGNGCGCNGVLDADSLLALILAST